MHMNRSPFVKHLGRFFSVCFFFATHLACSLAQDWYAVGPSGVTTREVTKDIYGNLYLGTSQGVYWSIGGDHWHPITTNGLGQRSVLTLAVNTQATLMAGGVNGTYRLTYGSDTWERVTEGLPNNAYIYALAVDAGDNFVAIIIDTWESNRAVYKLQANGKKWVNLNLPNYPYIAQSIAIDSMNRVYVATGYSGIVKHRSDGTWVEVNNGLPRDVPDFIGINGLAVDSRNGLYTTHRNGGVYHLPSEGNEWIELSRSGLADSHPWRVRVDNQDNIYVAGQLPYPLRPRVFKLQVGSMQWSDLGSVEAIDHLAIDNDHAVYASSFLYGLFKRAAQ